MPTTEARTLTVSFELRDTNRTEAEVKAKLKNDWAGPGIREARDKERILQIEANTIAGTRREKPAKKRGKR